MAGRKRSRARLSPGKLRELEAAIHKTPRRSAARRAARRRFFRALQHAEELNER